MSFLKNILNRKKEETNTRESFPSNQIYAPVEGTIIRPSDLPDPVFSAELMGPSLVINPDSGKVFAPVSGKISMIYPTGHAFGITTPEGAEILIHIGIDTVSLDGRGFTVLKKQGQSASPDEPVVLFDPAVVKNAGLSCATMVILTNPDLFTLKAGRNYGDHVHSAEEIAQLRKI